MTEADDNPKSEPSGESLDENVKHLLRSALSDRQPPPADVLGGVQRKLRQRSRGKFYADRWSTEKQPPVLTYLITSLFMLAIVFVIYAVLAPLRGEPAAVESDPVPIRIVPPR